MKKQTFIISTFILMIMICIVTFFAVSKQDYHKQITGDGIDTVIAWSDFSEYKYHLKDEEIENLVSAFNGAQYNKANDDFEGITPSYGIQVTLSSGETITINEAESSYGNIEVQRNMAGKHVSYWIESHELDEFLKQVCFAK